MSCVRIAILLMATLGHTPQPMQLFGAVGILVALLVVVGNDLLAPTTTTPTLDHQLHVLQMAGHCARSAFARDTLPTSVGIVMRKNMCPTPRLLRLHQPLMALILNGT
jgi:hypothetical protein